MMQDRTGLARIAVSAQGLIQAKCRAGVFNIHVKSSILD
jgi:hypothetical protein